MILIFHFLFNDVISRKRAHRSWKNTAVLYFSKVTWRYSYSYIPRFLFYWNILDILFPVFYFRIFLSWCLLCLWKKLIFEGMYSYEWIGRGSICLKKMFRSSQNQIWQKIYHHTHIRETKENPKSNNNFYMLLMAIQNGTATLLFSH